ncbi:MAG: prepilin-type N-terminal cleavage/methylation domain-containing protein [Lautropia sp.]|nr:prepilin-type N-terminal cleavage/methylation domain-containing protein [Lautropia sp.]
MRDSSVTGARVALSGRHSVPVRADDADPGHALARTSDGRPRRPHSRRPAGFTLIELLVAVGLLAILAVLSWRGLDSVLQSRDRLVHESNELRSLTLALAQLEEDLLQTWPVRSMGSRIVPVQVPLGQGTRGAASQSIVLVREVARRGLPTRLQRVVYQVRDGQLARGFSEWQQGSGGSAGATVGGAVQTLVWQPVLQDVRSITVRGWAGNTWLAGEQLARLTSSNEVDVNGNPLPGITSTTPDEVRDNLMRQRELSMVRGLEVIIERTNGQRFVRIYSTQD